MIVRAYQPERIVIGADTRLLTITLKNSVSFVSAQPMNPYLHLKKAREEWRIRPFALEKGQMYFDLKDTSALQYKGLYKAALWMNDCLIDQLEMVKAPSYWLEAETTEDACSEGTWDESCEFEPIGRCKTTNTYKCGCDCADLEGAKCPACLEQVTYATENAVPGY